MTEEEFERAVRRNINTVLRLAFSYTGNYAEAQDASQDVFLKLFSENKSFDSPEGEKAWLIRVTINNCLNRRRSFWSSRRCELDENIKARLPEEESGVLEAVLSLPEKYRAPIHLHYYEGYSIKEIAEMTGTNPSTTATRLQRGRELLRNKLEEKSPAERKSFPKAERRTDHE